MEDLTFTNLELQIESLIHARDHLHKENLSLRQKLSRTTQERAKLSEKNKSAIVRIKRIISHLKTELRSNKDKE